jgi:hypothetical protein
LDDLNRDNCLITSALHSLVSKCKPFRQFHRHGNVGRREHARVAMQEDWGARGVSPAAFDLWPKAFWNDAKLKKNELLWNLSQSAGRRLGRPGRSRSKLFQLNRSSLGEPRVRQEG